MHGKVSRIYNAVIGSPEEAGKNLYQCAQQAGLTEATYVHAIADGAPWCDALNPKDWLTQKKQMLKEGDPKNLLQELQDRYVIMGPQNEDNGLTKCIRYIETRIQYMDYRSAQEKGLSIGSGEIESSHKHVVQKRLKIAGAWWRLETANSMLKLRVARGNGYWNYYWETKNAA